MISLDSLHRMMLCRNFSRSLIRVVAKTPSSKYFQRSRQTRLPLLQQQHHVSVLRHYATQTAADDIIEEITELYATARDEFEIAAEETEKMTVYAEDDRQAARQELTKLQEAFRRTVDGPDKALAGEVQRRVGQRIRELENAVAAMEEMAQNQD